MIRRYLAQSEEKVFAIYEQQDTQTKYIGRVLISKFGAMVFKDDLRIFLTWEELEAIMAEKPAQPDKKA